MEKRTLATSIRTGLHICELQFRDLHHLLSTNSLIKLNTLVTVFDLCLAGLALLSRSGHGKFQNCTSEYKVLFVVNLFSPSSYHWIFVTLYI